MAACREFVVRRARVAEAIGWLQTHNPAYADVLVHPENLAALPEEGAPDALLVAAQSLPHDLSPDAVVPPKQPRPNLHCVPYLQPS